MNVSEYLTLRPGDKVVVEYNQLKLIFSIVNFETIRKNKTGALKRCVLSTDVINLRDLFKTRNKNLFSQMDGKKLRWQNLRPGFKIIHLDSGFVFIITRLGLDAWPYVTCMLTIEPQCIGLLQFYDEIDVVRSSSVVA